MRSRICVLFGTKTQKDAAFCTVYEYGVYEATEQGRAQSVHGEISRNFAGCRAWSYLNYC